MHKKKTEVKLVPSVEASETGLSGYGVAQPYILKQVCL